MSKLHRISWYKPGKKISVNDKMQKGYTYKLTAKYGKLDFKPELSPKQMLKMGVFEGHYLNDCRKEFPLEWFTHAKLSPQYPNSAINEFKIKSRLSLREWRKRKWIIQPDNRGWFQWYCRYYIGRREPKIDRIQINRWNSFKRHRGQILASYKRMKRKHIKIPKTKSQKRVHRAKQRQALLQWAYNPYI